MSDLDELDKPYTVIRDNGTRSRFAANFEAMTPDRAMGWADRSYRHWRRRRLPLLLVPLVLGVLLGLLDQSWNVGIGAAGLGFDIVGAWLLGEAVLVSDDEADSYGTHWGIENRGFIARRDSRQAKFALVILTVGFVGQLASLVLSVWPGRLPF